MGNACIVQVDQNAKTPYKKYSPPDTDETSSAARRQRQQQQQQQQRQTAAARQQRNGVPPIDKPAQRRPPPTNRHASKASINAGRSHRENGQQSEAANSSFYSSVWSFNSELQSTRSKHDAEAPAAKPRSSGGSKQGDSFHIDNTGRLTSFRGRYTPVEVEVLPIFGDGAEEIRRQLALQEQQGHYDERGFWVDDAFPASDKSIFFEKDSKLVEQLSDIYVKWTRARDIVADAKLFVDTEHAGTVVEGRLKSAWFLGSIACVATHATQIAEIFGGTEIRNNKGKYCVRFYKHGKVRAVLVDDFLPTVDGKLIFGQSLDPSEIWISIIEKAYAKLHKCYEAILNGSCDCALADLTNGLAETIHIAECKEDIESGQMWRKIIDIQTSGAFMCCTASKLLDESNERNNGIAIDKAYSIIQATQTSGGVKLLQLKCPWGEGKTWTGAFSETSAEMTETLKKELASPSALTSDGVFFITFEDFCKYFQHVFIAHVLRKNWQKRYIEWKWTADAGGGGGDWFKNPQFIITAASDQATRIIVNVAREDARLTASQTGSVQEPHMFVVLQKHPKKGSHTRIFRRDQEVVTRPHRELTRVSVIQPGETWVVVPALQTPSSEPFYLTIYSQGPIDVEPAELADEGVCVLSGEWTEDRYGEFQSATFELQHQYQLDFNCPDGDSAPFSYCLIQNLDDCPERKPQRVSIMLMLVAPDVAKIDNESKQRNDVMLCTSSKTSYRFESLWFNDASLPIQDGYRYLVIPTLFDPLPAGSPPLRFTLIFWHMAHGGKEFYCVDLRQTFSRRLPGLRARSGRSNLRAAIQQRKNSKATPILLLHLYSLLNPIMVNNSHASPQTLSSELTKGMSSSSKPQHRVLDVTPTSRAETQDHHVHSPKGAHKGHKYDAALSQKDNINDESDHQSESHMADKKTRHKISNGVKMMSQNAN